MNLCDYYVKEVLSEPIKRIYTVNCKRLEWWEVKVSYIYDNGKEVTNKLRFDTKEEAQKVEQGFHFTA